MTESEIEAGLINKLVNLKYTNRPDIRDRQALERNFRQKFEELNNIQLSDTEFKRLRDDVVKQDVFAAAKILRSQNTFIREDGTPLHYSLVNIKDWCKNQFEIVSQLRINTDNSHHRYDVILLVNGIPMVQIELKSLEISPKRAMQQIVDYKVAPGNGYGNTLLCFIQLFVVSNRTTTFYFANNSAKHFAFSADEQYLPVYKFADRENNKITHLDEFAEHFLAKCTLAEMISRFMVLVETEQKLLVMRPYQIYAVKAIIDCVRDNRGNGYIWHTTGSGKTLTSFKASTLLKANPDIDKCLFVVDRKDLDRQTREEFNRFQEGCVEENTNTEALVQRLLSKSYADKVIVTTIQKLGIALDPTNPKAYKERLQALSDQRIVFIFDECHRSQFGDNHKAIRNFFPKAQLFGFTGTPIFVDNSSYTRVDNGQEASLVTTKDIFQKELHHYTITEAIEDGNVLRFHVDYFKGEGKTLKPGEGIAQQAVVDSIIHKHEAATQQRRFNAFLATQSIDHAIKYYDLFAETQARKQLEDDTYVPLNIVCIFSPPADGNQDVKQIQEDLVNEKKDNEVEPDRKKAALIRLMAEYNAKFGTNHILSEFDSYYQDIQKRIKDQQWPLQDFPHKKRIDITIVVDMLLTGFDAKYLNTLYVDKNLQYHGLIQAFSRTNRIINATKPYGHILDFRQQQDAVNAAISLFSGIDKAKAKEIWLVDPAPVVLKHYEEAVQRLGIFMESQGLKAEAHEVNNLKGDDARAEFVNHFKDVQRYRTQLDQYTDLKEEDKEKLEVVLPKDDLLAFRGAYLETARQLRDKQQTKSGQPSSAAVDQLEFEFVLFASTVIDYDYIMRLMAESTGAKPQKEKMTRDQIISLIRSSANMMEEAPEMVEYFSQLPTDRGYTVKEMQDGYLTYKKQAEEAAITAVAEQIGIEQTALADFVASTVERAVLDIDELSELMDALDLGWKARAAKEVELMKVLIPVLKKMANGHEIAGLNVYEL